MLLVATKQIPAAEFAPYLLFGDELQASYRPSLTPRPLLVDYNCREQNRSAHQVLIKGIDI